MMNLTTVVHDNYKYCFTLRITDQPDEAERVGILLTIALNSITAVLAVSQNSIILWTLLRTQSLHRPSFILLGCLAFTDFITGLICQTGCVAYAVFKYYRNWNHLCTAIEFVVSSSVILTGVSNTTLAVISIDRYLALHFHLRYNELVTIQRVLVLFALIWPASSTVLIPRYLGDKSTIIFTTIMSFLCATFLSMIFYFYWKIYKIAQRHQRQIHTLNPTRPRLENILKIRNSSLNFLIITIVLILCITPYLVFALCFVFIGYKGFVIPFGDISISILLASASINPVIYVWRLGELRIAVRQVLKICFKHTE